MTASFSHGNYGTLSATMGSYSLINEPDGSSVILFAVNAFGGAFCANTGAQADEVALVEGVAASHLSRSWETHYWRDGREVDAVALEGGRQVGVETKWGSVGGRKPRHLSAYLLLDRKTVPLFLASLGRSQTDATRP